MTLVVAPWYVLAALQALAGVTALLAVYRLLMYGVLAQRTRVLVFGAVRHTTAFVVGCVLVMAGLLGGVWFEAANLEPPLRLHDLVLHAGLIVLFATLASVEVDDE